MTKKDIVRVISEELGLTQQQTKDVVQRTFDSIIETLVREGRIELRNFGVFEVKSRAARRARNPKTGQQVDVPEKFVVTFKPGKVMEQRVREYGQSKQPDNHFQWPAIGVRFSEGVDNESAPSQNGTNEGRPSDPNDSIRLSPLGRWDEPS